MIKRFLQLKATHLAAVSLGLVLGFGLIFSAGQMAKENSAKERGILEETALTVQDFEIASMKNLEDGGYVCTDGDPQLVYTPDGMFTGVEIEMTSSMPAGKIIAYYTTEEGAGYSEKNMLLLAPVKGKQNTFAAVTGAKYIYKLRLDPSEVAGNYLYFGKITLNGEKTTADYFGINSGNLPYMSIYTGLLWATLRFTQEFLQKFNIKATKK